MTLIATHQRLIQRKPALHWLLALAILSPCSCSHVLRNPGVLVFAGPGTEPDTLNPLLTQMSDASDLALLYMPVLLHSNERDRLIPEIATAVPTRSNGGISTDGRTIIYHLRRGVVWQDGVPLTARDVVFTFHAVMNPLNDVASRDGYDRIASVVAKDPWTVVVHMRDAYSPIIAQFCNYPAYPILPAHILARYPDLNRVPFNTLPIGAGPYKVVDWIHGDHIDFAANPRYWRGEPHILRLELRFIADPATAVAQLKTGELDAWFNVDPSAYPALVPSRVHLALSPMNDIHLLLLNLSDPALRDVRVRRAIAYALQLRFVAKAAVHGLGEQVNGDQPTFSWAYSKPRSAIQYDPRRARALLGAAGWHGNLSLTLAGTKDVTAWYQLAVLVQSELAAAGIHVSIKTYPAGLYFGASAGGGILRSGRFQMAYDARLLGVDPNDEAYYACNQFSPGGENVVHWCDPIADRAMKAAVATYETTERARDYAIVQERMAEDVPVVSLWQVRRVDAFSVPVRGFMPSPSGETFWNVWSWRIREPVSK